MAAKRDATVSHHEQYKRPKREPYSFAKEFDRQPCENPFENEDNVQFRFNYWQKESNVLVPDISKMILHVMSDGDDAVAPMPVFLRKPSSQYKHYKHLIIVAAHGVHPMDMGRDISNLPFLSTCTSAPLRHSEVQPSPGNYLLSIYLFYLNFLFTALYILPSKAVGGTQILNPWHPLFFGRINQARHYTLQPALVHYSCLNVIG